jgi:hypothetical protein
MTKNQIISGVIVCTALAIFSGYVLLKETTTSFISPLPSSAVNPPSTPTPPMVVATNTQTHATISPTPTASTVITEQVSPEMGRLLKLVSDCKVESIDFGDTYGNTFKSIKSVLLKDGTLFDNPGVVGANDTPILIQAVRDVKDKCSIQTHFRLLDR